MFEAFFACNVYSRQLVFDNFILPGEDDFRLLKA